MERSPRFQTATYRSDEGFAGYYFQRQHFLVEERTKNLPPEARKQPGGKEIKRRETLKSGTNFKALAGFIRCRGVVCVFIVGDV